MRVDSNKRIIPYTLWSMSVLMLLAAACVHFFLSDNIYIREGRGFSASVWIMYLLFGALSCLIFGMITRRVAFPLFPSFVCLLAIILHFVGGIFDLYHSVVFYDHIMHALSTFSITILGIFFLFKAEDNGNLRVHPLIIMLLGFFTAIALGAIFEIREYAFSFFFQTIDQGGYHNTLGDLMYNTMGGIIASVYMVMETATTNPLKVGNKRYYGRKGFLLFLMSLFGLFTLFVFLRISEMKMEMFDQFDTSAVIFITLLRFLTVLLFLACSFQVSKYLVQHLPFVDQAPWKH